jgi:hypothetical protein
MQYSTQRSLIPHDNVVQALASDGAHQPFRKGIGMSVQLRRMAMLKFDVSE